MKDEVNWLNESSYIAPLSPGCEMCANGSKLVLLITGMCDTKCYYCPLSFEKGGKDRIFANEWELNNEKDTEKLILEAKYIDATGAGITGGDPLLVWKRTKNYITILKDNFGPNFHIHLYTSGFKNGEYLKDIIAAGLDEVRFHPNPLLWDKMDKNPIKKTIETSLREDIDVAIEIPSIPKMEKQISSLIKWADEIGINWINLNELEYSERNADIFYRRNYIVKDDISAAVKGSQETAYSILKWASKEDFDIGIHYCSSSFKDGIQLTRRIKRRAKNIAKDYEIISKEGTLIKGVIYINQKSKLKDVYNLIKKDFNIEEKHICLNNEKKRIEIGLWILERIAPELKKQGLDCFMVEEYPTADGLEVERIPLPI